MRCAVFVLCLVAGTPAFAQHMDAGHDTPDMPGMQHHLGTVAFANSCSPAAQPDLLLEWRCCIPFGTRRASRRSATRS